MKTRRAKSSPAFNIAFLDVMACGLGAVILILMLVDFESFELQPKTEGARLERALAEQQDELDSLQSQIAALDALIAAAAAERQGRQSAIADARSAQQSVFQSVSRQQAVVADLERQLAALAPVETASDNIALSGRQEQNYLLGLKVEGEHIGILLDKSASMTADKLLDILRYKGMPPAARRAAPKWRRALRTLQWLLARAPATARLTVVAFSDKATRLGDAGAAASAEGDLKKIMRDAMAQTPEGGTDLRDGLAAIAKAAPGVTDLYVITDGLPTRGKFSALQRFSRCASFFGRANTISGECRENLFVESLKTAPKVKTHVILLPLEGDPKAARLYWHWSAALGGTLIAPAANWP